MVPELNDLFAGKSSLKRAIGNTVKKTAVKEINSLYQTPIKSRQEPTDIKPPAKKPRVTLSKSSVKSGRSKNTKTRKPLFQNLPA